MAPDAIQKPYVQKYYPDSKSDLFAAFIEKCHNFIKPNAYQAMITMHSWMFLSSFEKLRTKLLKDNTIINMAHLGARAFEEIGGEVVQTTTFIFNNAYVKDYNSTFKRLVDYNSQDSKENAYLNESNLYHSTATNFSKIPGSPIAYWVNNSLLNAFNNEKLYDFSISPSQNITGNNEKFTKLWWELGSKHINQKDDYIFYAKGGGYRKWYGNLETVVNWSPEARKIYQYGDGKHASQIIKRENWYKKGITWGLITSSIPSFRVMPEGATFDKGGSTIIVKNEIYNFIIAFLNSKVFIYISSILNPTINLQVKDVRNMPILLKEQNIVEDYAKMNIFSAKSDYNSFETSWDFKVHPLVKNQTSTIKEAYALWTKECEDRFNTLKSNEEELNRIFIEIYGLQDELTPEVEDKDVTVRKADLTRDIKSFISYAVGCMFGRYSLDTEGLAYAGGEWEASKYKTYIPDKDDIIPITDEEYFEDDIVTRFIEFVRVVYGAETLEENLQFIAEALGGSGNAREIIRNYFLDGFYKDHCDTYQVTGSKKRPIYWLFESGKNNGFKALVYIHRYSKDLIARMRTGYVHELQSRYRTQISLLKEQIDNSKSQSEKVKLEKEHKKIKEQLTELSKYEEKVHHYADMMVEMDLDDGVRANYAKFEDLLAKLK